MVVTLAACGALTAANAQDGDLDVTMEVVGENASEERVVRELSLPEVPRDARGGDAGRGSERSGEARERGREFGQQRAESARERGEDARERARLRRDAGGAPDRPDRPEAGPGGDRRP